jgi:high-affinity nickel permease
MFYVLSLGFLIGLRHALEADHVAAVASLTHRTTSIKEGMKLGATWGLGHTVTLFLFGSVVLAMDNIVPERVAGYLEFAVGVMLVFMGSSVLKKLIKDKLHFHLHRHSNDVAHIHFHSHAKDNLDHRTNPHSHTHSQRFPISALLVGMMHGMAGSAALILLTLDSVSSVGTGLAYILLFGAGSILGMALLSIVIVLPLRYSEKATNWTFNGIQTFIGFATLILGLITMYQVSIIDGLFV